MFLTRRSCWRFVGRVWGVLFFGVFWFVCFWRMLENIDRVVGEGLFLFAFLSCIRVFAFSRE